MLLLSGFALGCSAVMFLVVFREFRHLAVGKVFLVTLIAISCMFLRPAVSEEWRPLLSNVMTAVPALFWLLCQMTFSHRPRFFSIWSFIALYSFIPPAIYRSLSSEVMGIWGYYLAWRIPSISEYVLTLNGLWVIVVNWSDDLVESRRKLRGIVLGGFGLTTLIVTSTMNFGWGHIVSVPLISAIACLFTAAFIVKGRTGALLGEPLAPTSHHSHHSDVSIQQRLLTLDPLTERPTEPVQRQPVTPSVTAPFQADFDPSGDTASPQPIDNPAPSSPTTDTLVHLSRLQSMMQDGFYRREKLTLPQLASAMNLPEYKTRELINKHLGYRNFNGYINQLRISESCHRLIQEPDTPVLNISLDVGYRTLSSFNRAFKDIMKCSPTEFRQRQSLAHNIVSHSSLDTSSTAYHKQTEYLSGTHVQKAIPD